MRKWVLGAGAALVALCGVIGVRTALFEPTAVADGAAIRVAPATPFDLVGAANHLGEAIRFETVSNQEPAQNREEEWDRLHRWLENTYPRFHAAARREAIGKSLLYTWTGSDPAAQPIILMAHQDVVPVTPGTERDWKYPPFAGTIADGAVWGRGSVDDKGSLIALFEALEALAARGFVPKRTVYLVSGYDEEAGGSGAEAVAKILAERKVKALFTLDEGGVIITDPPAGAGPAMMIGVAEKGYATLRVTAPAPGGHSSNPPAETGAVHLARAILAINGYPFPLELRSPTREMVELMADRAGGAARVAAANQWLFAPLIHRQMSASPASAAMLHTTIAPTMLVGSPKENVLPQDAHALINYRIAPWDSSAEVLARAREAVRGLPVKVDFTARKPREPSPVSSATSPGWQAIVAAAKAGHPGVPAVPHLVIAGTDSRSMSGVSDDVYRFQPLAIASAEIKMIHGTNEHMTLGNLDSMISFFTRLVATAAG